MKKIIYTILAVIVIVLLVMFVNRQSAGVQGEIVIGAPLSFTGTATVDGMSIKHGMDLAQADLAKVGVKVRIIYEDDGTDPKRTVSAVQKILSSEKVDVLIGPTWSFLHDAAAPVIAAHHVVSYSPANTSEFTSTKSQDLFFGTVKNVKKLEPTAKWLKNVGATKVAIIVDKSGWGESHMEAFTQATTKAGAQVVLVEKIPFGSEKDSIPTILAKVRASKADAILWTGYDEGAVILINKLQELKMRTPFLAASSIPAELVKNKVISINPESQMSYMKTKVSVEFAEKFYGVYGVYPDSYADSAYDGVMLVVDALKHKSATQSLSDYMRNTTNYKGFQTDYSFDENGDIKGGEWVVERLK